MRPLCSLCLCGALAATNGKPIHYDTKQHEKPFRLIRVISWIVFTLDLSSPRISVANQPVIDLRYLTSIHAENQDKQAAR